MLRVLAIIALLWQEGPKALSLEAPKGSKPSDLAVAAKALSARCVEYGYTDLLLAVAGGGVQVTKKDRTALEASTAETVVRLASLPGRDAALRVVHRMTAADHERYKPNVDGDGRLSGASPPGTTWLWMGCPRTMKKLGTCYPIADAPVVRMADLSKFSDKAMGYPVRYKPNATAERALRSLDRDVGDQPFSQSLALVLDGLAFQDPLFAVTFVSVYEGGKKARKMECFLHVNTQQVLTRDFPLLPLAIAEHPLPFALSLKADK